jgi:hypothetical protein
VKTTNYLFSFAIGSLLVFGGMGCHKQTASFERPKTLDEGIVQLQAALATASPDARSNFNVGVNYNVRYENYAKADAALQQIASDPSLNDQQKKLVSDVSDLVKQAAAAKPAH